MTTLYRNLVKERALGRDTGTLHVMMKGGDWTFGCQLVDGALGALDTAPSRMPARIFTLVWLVGELLTDPKHFFRSFTVKELGRLMTARPTAPLVRAHEMGIYKRYFDLIASGRKTTEIRVNDSSRKNRILYGLFLAHALISAAESGQPEIELACNEARQVLPMMRMISSQRCRRLLDLVIASVRGYRTASVRALIEEVEEAGPACL